MQHDDRSTQTAPQRTRRAHPARWTRRAVGVASTAGFCALTFGMAQHAAAASHPTPTPSSTAVQTGSSANGGAVAATPPAGATAHTTSTAS